MKIESKAPKEDPETKARRLVDEARAEADKTSAMQGVLERRQRRVMRVFGQATGGDSGFGSSGSSGVVATPSFSGFTGFGGSSGASDPGALAGFGSDGSFNPRVQIFSY